MTYVAGVDVSHWQGTVNWPAVKAAGYHFVFIKATEGSSTVDPMYQANRAGAKAAGLVVGSYHFARQGDPVAQADFFCKVTGNVAVGEMACLDYEDQTIPVGSAWCRAWLNRVTAVAGVRPWLYTNGAGLAGKDWRQVVADGYPLWLAKPDGQPTVQPTAAPWPSVGMKQFSWTVRAPWVNGFVDADALYGDLSSYTKVAPAGPVVPRPVSPTPPDENDDGR